MVDQRARADHERGAAAALRQRVLDRCARRQHLVGGGLEAEPPQLAHELLGGVTDVVGKERHRRARGAQRRDRLGRALDGFVAHPQAPVEVEQHLLVGPHGGGNAHGRCLSSPPMPRPAFRLLVLLALMAACALGLAACGGGDKEAEATATATPRRRRRRRGLRAGRGARAEGRGEAAQAQGAAGGRQDLRREGLHELRRLRVHARRQARPAHRRRVQVPGRQGLLRQPDVPPDLLGLRDPGRRPEGRRDRRPGLHRGRGAAQGPRLRQGRRRDGQGRRRAARRLRQPVLRGDCRGRPAPARLRAAGQGDRGPGRRRQDRPAADDAGRAADPARDHQVDHGHGR